MMRLLSMIQKAPQATQDTSAPDDRATEFQAVADTGEHYSGYTLMVEAYAAIWLILMVWLVLIWRKATDLTSRVDGLERAIARAEGKAAVATPGQVKKAGSAAGPSTKETTA